MTVAGHFYPGEPRELAAEVSRLLAAARPGPPPKALIAPHAGYIYSGPIAASVFRRVQGRSYERVVLLGPAHFAFLRGLALPSRPYATPLGEVPLADADLPHDDTAHAREHSMEVEVPFLQVALKGPFRLTPIAVGDSSPVQVAMVLDALWGGPETLIVISSDLSHYLPWARARQVDEATAEEIVSLGELDHHQACGASPVNGLLLTARQRRMRAELVDLRNSGDTAGDKSRVVGYGAFAFYES